MPVTIHEQIVQRLRDQMDDGTLPPGAQVPSSRVLAEEWDCARETASGALRALARDGLIVHRKGLGFFVTDTPVARPAGHRAAGTTRLDDALPFKILGEPGYRVPPPQVARALEIGESEDALVRTRLLFLPVGDPVSVVDAWFPRGIAERCELLHRTAPIPGGTTKHIIARTGLRPASGRDVTTPRSATVDEQQVLALDGPSPVQVVLHAARTADGTVVVVEEGVTPEKYAVRVDEYPMEP
jgi:GntR family transcriptional regulator